MRRLEYLEEFLLGVNEGGEIKYAEERLAAKKKFFELEKSKAVGRGRPFMKRLEEAHRLTELCRTMAMQLDLIEGDGNLAVSSFGRKYLDSSSETRSHLLIGRMLQTYVRFERLVKGLSLLEGNELVVPMSQDRALFLEVMGKAGLQDFSRIYFETVVNLATELGLTNWYPKDVGPRTWVLYLTCSIRFSQSEEGTTRGLIVHLRKETWRISFNAVPLEDFREQLWKDYLSLTGYVARKPVLYSNLRGKVCYSLRISDELFDVLAWGMMGADSKYLLVGAGGTLSFRRDSASLIKSLPPKTDRGEYMVYLKMDKRV